MFKNRVGLMGLIAASNLLGFGGTPAFSRFLLHPEGDNSGGGGGGGEQKPPEKKPEGGTGDDGVKFTPEQQRKVDRLLSNAKKDAAQKELDKVKAQLEAGDLSAKQVATLEKTRDELQESIEGERATATRKVTELKTQHEKEMAAEKTRTSVMESKFKKSEIKRQLRECKDELGIKRESQIQEMIEHKVKVFPAKDENGVTIPDEYVVGIEVDVPTGDGKKKVKKVLDIVEYVKLLSEDTENDNLFVSGRVGGTGGKPPINGKGGGKKVSSAEKINAGLAKMMAANEG